MRNYEYAISPTSQFYFCGVPFRLDIKPKCDLNCVYCFAMSRGGRRTNKEQMIDIESVERKFRHAIYEDCTTIDVVGELLRNRIPIHVGGMSDPFSDADTSIAFDKVLSIFSDLEDYPMIISTKRPYELLKRDRVIRKKNLIIQISLPLIDEQMSSKIEPKAETAIDRLSAMKSLVSLGKNVVCRVQPVIPQFGSQLHELVDAICDSGCKHVIFEYLKLPVERNSLNVKLLSECLNEDIYRYYRTSEAVLVGREWLLPLEYRYERLMSIKGYANDKGISVSLADYGLGHLSDVDCCCGVDKFGMGCNWNRGNISTLLKNKKGLVHFSYILEYWHPSKSMTKYINSKSRINENTMMALLRKKWNSPGTVNAPDSYYGVSFTGNYDDDCNCIYSNNT